MLKRWFNYIRIWTQPTETIFFQHHSNSHSSLLFSHQTYESFEKVREDVSINEEAQDSSTNNLTQPQSGGVYKRSHSLATPQLLQVGNPHSADDRHQSFSNDTQVRTTWIHDFATAWAISVPIPSRSLSNQLPLDFFPTFIFSIVSSYFRPRWPNPSAYLVTN